MCVFVMISLFLASLRYIMHAHLYDHKTALFRRTTASSAMLTPFGGHFSAVLSSPACYAIICEAQDRWRSIDSQRHLRPLKVCSVPNWSRT